MIAQHDGAALTLVLPLRVVHTEALASGWLFAPSDATMPATTNVASHTLAGVTEEECPITAILWLSNATSREQMSRVAHMAGVVCVDASTVKRPQNGTDRHD